MAVSAETQAWCLENLGATSTLESESKPPRPYGNQPTMFSNGKKLAANQRMQKAKKLTPRRKEVIRAFFREAYERPHKFGVTDENGWVRKLLERFREPVGSLTTFEVEKWLSNPEFEERFQRLRAVFREKHGDKNGMSSSASLSSGSSQSVSIPTSPSSSNGDDQTETDESIESILTGRFEEGLRQQGAQAVHNMEKAAGMKKNENAAQQEQQHEHGEKDQQQKQQVGGECPVQVYHGGFFIQLPPRSQHTTFLIQPTAWSVSVYPTSTWDPDSTVAAFSGLNINGGQTYHPFDPSGGADPNGVETPTENGKGASSMVPPGTQACNCLSCSGKK